MTLSQTTYDINIALILSKLFKFLSAKSHGCFLYNISLFLFL